MGQLGHTHAAHHSPAPWSPTGLSTHLVTWQLFFVAVWTSLLFLFNTTEKLIINKHIWISPDDEWGVSRHKASRCCRSLSLHHWFIMWLRMTTKTSFYHLNFFFPANRLWPFQIRWKENNLKRLMKFFTQSTRPVARARALASVWTPQVPGVDWKAAVGAPGANRAPAKLPA